MTSLGAIPDEELDYGEDMNDEDVVDYDEDMTASPVCLPEPSPDVSLPSPSAEPTRLHEEFGDGDSAGVDDFESNDKVESSGATRRASPEIYRPPRFSGAAEEELDYSDGELESSPSPSGETADTFDGNSVNDPEENDDFLLDVDESAVDALVSVYDVMMRDDGTTEAAASIDSGFGSRGRSTDGSIATSNPDVTSVEREPLPPMTRKKCYLAYHELEGFPKIRPDYPFLQLSRGRSRPPEIHQFLHLCHDGDEEQLLHRLQYLLTEVFECNKVVIFARRSERLVNIRKALQKHKMDSYLLKGDDPLDRLRYVFKHFEQGTRRILLCAANITPPVRCLNGVNLVVYWNTPWPQKGSDLQAMKDRIPTKALILVFIKQEVDWEFLDNRKADGILFPELDIDSEEPQYAGFINVKFAAGTSA